MGMKCPKCGKYPMCYTTDRSGNVRRYRCDYCAGVWIATLKDIPSKTAMFDSKVVSPNVFDWVRVLK